MFLCPSHCCCRICSSCSHVAVAVAIFVTVGGRQADCALNCSGIKFSHAFYCICSQTNDSHGPTVTRSLGQNAFPVERVIGQCCVECSCLWICHWPPLGIVKIICLETQFSWLVGHIFMVHFVSRGKCIFPNLWFTMVFPWRNFWNSLRARWGKMCGKYESL